MAAQIEQIVNRCMHTQESLSLPCRFESSHPPLSTPDIHPKALQDITGVNCVRFVGYNCYILLPPISPFRARCFKYSAREFQGGLIKPRKIS